MMAPLSANENLVVPGSRRPLLAMMILALVFLALVISSFDNFQVGVYMDDAHYIGIARSLAAGNGYVYPNYPDTVNIPPAFPIGFPLALAPVIALFPNSYDALKLVALVFTLINGFLIYRFWPGWTRSSAWWGVAIAGSYWLHVMVVGHARMVMSEPVFLTIYLLLVAAVASYQDDRQRWWSWPAIGFLALALTATRTIGLAVVAGVVFSLLVQIIQDRSWRRLIPAAAFLAISMILIAILLQFNVAIIPERYWIGNNSSYLHGLVEMIRGEPETETTNQGDLIGAGPIREAFVLKLGNHLKQDISASILRALPSVAARIDGQLSVPFVQTLLGIIILFIIVLGGARWLLRVGWHVLWITGLAYAGVLIFWNWANVRLLYAIEPHIMYAFYLGCFSLLQLVLGRRADPFGNKLAEFYLLVLIISLFVIKVPMNILASQSITHVGDLTVRTSWLNENTYASQVIMSEYPQIDYLYLPRQMVNWPNVDSPEELRVFLQDHAVEYLLLAPEIAWDVPVYVPNWSKKMTKTEPLIEALEAQSQLKMLFEDTEENLQVYQVVNN